MVFPDETVYIADGMVCVDQLGIHGFGASARFDSNISHCPDRPPGGTLTKLPIVKFGWTGPRSNAGGVGGAALGIALKRQASRGRSLGT